MIRVAVLMVPAGLSLFVTRPAGTSFRGRAAMTKQLTPLAEELRARTARPAVYLYRAAASHARSHVRKTSPEHEAKTMFGDQVTEVVLRTAASSATTGSPTWAGALARTSIEDSIAAITSVSAAAGLIVRGMKTSF